MISDCRDDFYRLNIRHNGFFQEGIKVKRLTVGSKPRKPFRSMVSLLASKATESVKTTEARRSGSDKPVPSMISRSSTIVSASATIFPKLLKDLSPSRLPIKVSLEDMETFYPISELYTKSSVKESS